ncbi:lipopolysaccharide heptosyltransferase family protein [Bizionia argentinensis JUB59]|uniref:Lipopolysaccharide heptosyltransferase family protein n=1 Tax=Bizionia argentinensis JUB59 TaxID=1046627 RepID=G2EF57_9FLAO|nr:glycosyltransferase family 9 protein [Bizionia argentinensis]EGV42928.1 lipopolysaccharide heptosyltransferase family protein [Bizionia argentinensis JUB59]
MKILVIQQKMIGDVLTSSILFEALRERYPKAQLDYLINSHTMAVVENNPFIDNYILLTPEVEKRKSALWDLAIAVRKSNYDVVIDVYSKLSSNLITTLSGAKIKISYYKSYTSVLYTHNIKRLKHTNKACGLAIVNRLQLLEPLDIKIQAAKPKIYLTSKELETSKQFLISKGISLEKPLIMISVLGSGPNKTYPFEYMAKVIDQIVDSTDGQILFNYIPKQEVEAQAIFNLCQPETQNHIYMDLFGKSIREFLALTAHCHALIGNEGGAVNMAKALNIKTFTIFSTWVDKATWNIFEEENVNESVHLKDYQSKLYSGKTEKKVKPHAMDLYQKFTPDLFKIKLDNFLKSL